VERSPEPGPWLEALRGELELLRREGRFVPVAPLETLYVGGGTPSLLGSGAMSGVRALLGRHLLSAPELEWTAEANPESFTSALAADWRKAGVNRVSLGVQSFQEPVLRWMGRLHGAQGAGQAVATARGAGFRNLSIDLIFGLPPQLGRSWRADLERAVLLEVPHLSLYGLTAEEGTRLGSDVAARRERLADPEQYREEYLEAAERLRAAGYLHYEVSSFSLPGMESAHNRVYWSGRPYLGMGNSAHSFRAPVRRWNLRDWAGYLTSVREGRLPVAGSEELTEESSRLEAFWLGLRVAEGLAMKGLPAPALRRIDEWVRRGWAESDPGRVRLTPEGWLLLDRLTVELEAESAG